MQRCAVALITVLPCILVVLLAQPAAAKDTINTITWMEVSMPPYFIQEGPEKQQRYGDVVSAILQEQLPEYEHLEVVTNVTRHFHKFKQGEKVCSVGLS